MKFLNISAWLLVCIVFCSTASAQGNVLTYVPGKTVTAKPGGIAEAVLSLKLDSNYHVNSNAPSDPYLIPLRLTWNPGSLETIEILFPPARIEKFGFSEKPLSVFTGEFNIVTRFRVPTTVSASPGTLTGKLRYQACNDRMCLSPKTIDVTIPLEIAR